MLMFRSRSKPRWPSTTDGRPSTDMPRPGQACDLDLWTHALENVISVVIVMWTWWCVAVNDRVLLKYVHAVHSGESKSGEKESQTDWETDRQTQRQIQITTHNPDNLSAICLLLRPIGGGRSGVEVAQLVSRSMNNVNLRRARLVLGWVTVRV